MRTIKGEMSAHSKTHFPREDEEPASGSRVYRIARGGPSKKNAVILSEAEVVTWAERSRRISRYFSLQMPNG